MADLRPYILAKNICDDEANFIAWLQGRYFYEAVSVAISNAFRSRGQKTEDYASKPYELRPQKTNSMYADEETRKGEEAVKANMMAYTDMLRKRFEARKTDTLEERGANMTHG